MSVRLYGRDVGNGSLAVVTRGFREALEGARLLEGVVALDRGGGSEEDDAPPGALARDGVFTGNLNFVPVMQRQARHERHWVQVTPNSTFVPKELLGAILKLPNVRLLSCSRWGTEQILQALQEMGAVRTLLNKDSSGEALFPNHFTVPVLTVRHGVSGFAPAREELQQTRADFERGEFRVVHFSTTDGERKGTLELVKAWEAFTSAWASRRTSSIDQGGAQLFLVLDHHARAALQQRMTFDDLRLPEGVTFVPRADLDGPGMSKLLGHMHLVACPSRGEGFGLLPLQARAAGVPCIATTTTGHSAGHVSGRAIVPIQQTDELQPIDDGPAALAPPLEPEAITKALRHAREQWRRLSLHAEGDATFVRDDWSWGRQLAPLLESLR